MPKIVDPVARRRAVAQAVLAVVARRGLEHVSLRNVAEEAGLAIGSVRHYFTDRDELMIFTMRELSHRIEERVRLHAERLLDPGGCTDRRRSTEQLLAEFLPLDEIRREEAGLWHAFTALAHLRPDVRACAAEMQQAMHALVARVLHEAQGVGALPHAADIELESTRLTALLDGLTLQAALFPDRFPPELLQQVLRRHLDTLRSGE
ncbi:TetR family transcriptional regulator C-terminal domain-containing protein [Streptomyces sp. RS10V-4]|uniref:TetR/AcrR family transcriptional regulator n=1 Tax=Streptomyces rhizoryzae TaxID=2932493 RepID=UPI0020044B15|nr:TetR family transcriptional regulator C-terminal domain-containing protein [Streptomyces rhizoryzae]MCK7621828.1 TetR family transcriptional regulator C-terminal domain-containing protein [Streptomyces rhizoryzae]